MTSRPPPDGPPVDRPAHRVPHQHKATRAQKRAPWILLAPFLALFVLTFVIPIISALFQSFTTVDRKGLFGEDGVTGRFAGFDNYVIALKTAGSSPRSAACCCSASSRCR